jgi:hypothetical protein
MAISERQYSENQKFLSPRKRYCKVYSRTTQALWNSPDFPSYVKGPSTQMLAIIIFTNMCARDSSKYSLSIPKTRVLMHSQNLWHKITCNVIGVAICAASDLVSKPPK